MPPTKVAASSARRKASDVDKYELAAYLVNLHTLIDAQSKVVDTASNTLAEEYALVGRTQAGDHRQQKGQTPMKQGSGNRTRGDQKSNRSRRRSTLALLVRSALRRPTVPTRSMLAAAIPHQQFAAPPASLVHKEGTDMDFDEISKLFAVIESGMKIIRGNIRTSWPQPTIGWEIEDDLCTSAGNGRWKFAEEADDSDEVEVERR